jgi:hypothetical protein
MVPGICWLNVLPVVGSLLFWPPYPLHKPMMLTPAGSSIRHQAFSDGYNVGLNESTISPPGVPAS